MSDDIVVVGKRISDDYFFEAWLVSESGYNPHPVLSPSVPTDPPPPYRTIDFQVTCNSVNALAKRLGEHLDNNVMEAGGSEFSGVAIAAGGGQYKLFNDNMVTLDDVDQTVLVAPTGIPDALPLVFHNHPGGLNNTDFFALNRYPSSKDWATISEAVEVGTYNSSVKIAIQAPDRSVRIFNYSDKAYFTNLTQQQRIAGEGLPPEITSSAGCGR